MVFRLNPKTARERQGCEACHGTGSRHEQLHDFKAATRHNDRGRPMREVARLLTEDQMKALAEYLSAP